jgi:hypothetical protein
MSISKEEIENICNLLTQLKRSNRIYLNNIFDTCLSQNIVRENLKFEYPFIKNNYDTILYSFDKKLKFLIKP